MSRYAHIIPLGLDFDRTNFILREYPPFRIHFLDPDRIDDDYRSEALEVRKKIIERWPEPYKEYHTVHCFDFHSIIIDATKIMAIERLLGNQVIPHIFSGSRIYAVALYVAACLTDQKIIYLRARDYHLKGHGMIRSGVDPDTISLLENFPFILPSDYDCALLELLAEHVDIQKAKRQEPCWEGQRSELWRILKPCLQRRGIKMTNSPLVKLSNHMTDLESRKLIIRSGKKRLNLELTASGRLCAETGKIFGKVRKIRSKNSQSADFKSYLNQIDNTK